MHPGSAVARGGLLGALLLSAIAAPLGEANAPAASVPFRFDVHAAIRIIGDAGFADPLGGVRGGTGTIEDPYVIARWTIVPSPTPAVLLRGTRAHVLIEDIMVEATHAPQSAAHCSLDGRRLCHVAGVAAIDAQNVTIRRLDVRGGHFGAQVQDSRNVTIEDSEFGPGRVDPDFFDLNVGIDVRGSADVHVRNLTSLAADASIVVAEGSSRVLVENSSFPTGFLNLWPSVDGFVFRGNTHGHPVLLTENSLSPGGSLRDIAFINNVFPTYGIWTSTFGEALAIEGLIVCGNVFENAEQALDLNSVEIDRLTIRANRFIGMANAIAIHGPAISGVLVERNLVQNTWGDAGVAIQVPALVRNNSFVDFYGIYLEGAVDAAQNWWGDASGPSFDWSGGAGTGLGVTTVEGAVIAPWLAAPPEIPATCDVETAEWSAP